MLCLRKENERYVRKGFQKRNGRIERIGDRGEMNNRRFQYDNTNSK